MSTQVLVTGVIYRGPESRTDKNGRPFVTLTLFAKGLETASYWSIKRPKPSCCERASTSHPIEPAHRGAVSLFACDSAKRLR